MANPLVLPPDSTANMDRTQAWLDELVEAVQHDIPEYGDIRVMLAVARAFDELLKADIFTLDQLVGLLALAIRGLASQERVDQ